PRTIPKMRSSSIPIGSTPCSPLSRPLSYSFFGSGLSFGANSRGPSQERSISSDFQPPRISLSLQAPLWVNGSPICLPQVFACWWRCFGCFLKNVKVNSHGPFSRFCFSASPCGQWCVTATGTTILRFLAQPFGRCPKVQKPTLASGENFFAAMTPQQPYMNFKPLLQSTRTLLTSGIPMDLPSPVWATTKRPCRYLRNRWP